MQKKLVKKVKKRKLCLIIVVSILIGIIASVGISYALAATLINSKDVSYQDNSNLAADNVQSAIDGTCSKIDTRLSEIEDNLYKVKNIYESTYFTTTIASSYTGRYITLPAKSYCSITVCIHHNNARPNALALSTSSTERINTKETAYINGMIGNGHLCLTISEYNENAKNYYVWAATVLDGVSDLMDFSGFCATKYK